jgi:glyoxalase family protein
MNDSQQRPAFPLAGIHHVTAIASDPADNLDFYSQVLGQRLVKKTVNFDDPGTYHLYYGDGHGQPGSIMTFFPWPGARRGRVGAGQASMTSYAVPRGSLVFWQQHLERQGVSFEQPGERFGDRRLVLRDPDGLRLELIETDIDPVSDGAVWSGSPGSEIASEFAIRGFRGVVLSQPAGSGTFEFLSQVLGFAKVAEDGTTVRYRIDGAASSDPERMAGVLDVETSSDYGSPGAGTVHHVAFRVANDESEQEWRRYLAAAGYHVSPVMDRQYFHSIYFREPGGVLFEIATDPPGFAIDEPLESLGTELKLPAALESSRERIEAVLPVLPSLAASPGDQKRRAS